MPKVKKLMKIVFVNIILMIIFFMLIEVFSYIALYKKYKVDIYNFNKEKQTKQKLSYVRTYNINPQEQYKKFRPTSYKQNAVKKPIILFGCSYTEGLFLQNNQIFSKVLSDYTNRTVYNRGTGGSGIPFLYYQLNDKDLLKHVPQAEYIIFTLISDHFPRLFRYRNWVLSGDLTLRYKIVNHELVKIDNFCCPLSSLFLSIKIQEYLSEKNASNMDKTNELFYKLMRESYKLAKQKYPNAKFVILVYQDKYYDDKYTPVINELKKDGFIIVYTNELVGKELLKSKYYGIDNNHPGAAAWQLIVPKLSNKLNL